MTSEADAIAELLRDRGRARYGAEAVSQLQHALQCAFLAEREDAPTPLIAAALLHDLGHLVADDEEAAPQGIDMRHEDVAARYLARRFPPAVVEPVRLHVAAKRYLCAVEPGYFETLSFASVRSLLLQGGAFDEAGARAYIVQPHAAEAVRLRRWDDLAKDPAMATPPLNHYLPLIADLLQTAPATH
ncbi:MAG: phosphonate degradation HD-domain oxygenase [Alphaproteobacteria bacterium]